MNFKKVKLIIFDLDGTLIDTDELIIQSYRAVFDKFLPNYHLSMEEEKTFLGPPLEVMFKKYFQEDFSVLLKVYRDFAEKNTLLLAKLYPFVQELLSFLKCNNYKLCIVTSRFKKSALNMLDMFSLTDFFDDVIGLDDVINPKPNPEGINKILTKYSLAKDEVLFIGDAYTDLEAGKKAGVITGLVSWRKENMALDADLKIESYQFLKSLFR